MSASALIADVRARLTGEPVYLAGSLVAADTYGKTNAHHDVDIFCPTSQVLIATGQRLLDQGFKLDDRFSRVWQRWLRYGFKTWHTNSLRLVAPGGDEWNLVYKLTDGHPTTSLGQVFESFDFGLLATGYDLETDTFRDMRSYLFPGLDPDGPLPMMPNKRDNWRNGFISQYNALREVGRYVKYSDYGYDLSLVKDDLVTGYLAAAAYMATVKGTNQAAQDKHKLGKIYEAIGFYIEDDDFDQLREASKEIDYNDSLDVIMEALE